MQGLCGMVHILISLKKEGSMHFKKQVLIMLTSQKNCFDLPLIDTSIKYISPLLLGDNITIETIFKISKSPKIKIYSKFMNKSKKVLTIAEVNLVLINKNSFSIIRKRPDFISKAFLKLNG